MSDSKLLYDSNHEATSFLSAILLKFRGKNPSSMSLFRPYFILFQFQFFEATGLLGNFNSKQDA